MDKAGDLPIVTQRAAGIDDPSGTELPADDDSSAPLHPKHHLAKAIASALRTLALLLMAGGAVGALLWRADFRPPGALNGTANGIVIGLLMGTILLAIAAAVAAYLIELLFSFDWNAESVPVRSDGHA